MYKNKPVTGIDGYSFYGSSSYNRYGAFENTLVESVTIPNSVFWIGNLGDGNHGACFKNCSKLVNVQLSNTLVQIGESVFYGCTSLKNITIPKTIDNNPLCKLIIGNNSFFNCNNLMNVRIELDYIVGLAVPGFSGYAFDGTPSTMKVYVPNKFLNEYKETYYKYTNQFVGY